MTLNDNGLTNVSYSPFRKHFKIIVYDAQPGPPK